MKQENIRWKENACKLRTSRFKKETSERRKDLDSRQSLCLEAILKHFSPNTLKSFDLNFMDKDGNIAGVLNYRGIPILLKPFERVLPEIEIDPDYLDEPKSMGLYFLEENGLLEMVEWIDSHIKQWEVCVTNETKILIESISMAAAKKEVDRLNRSGNPLNLIDFNVMYSIAYGWWKGDKPATNRDISIDSLANYIGIDIKSVEASLDRLYRLRLLSKTEDDCYLFDEWERVFWWLCDSWQKYYYLPRIAQRFSLVPGAVEDDSLPNLLEAVERYNRDANNLLLSTLTPTGLLVLGGDNSLLSFATFLVDTPVSTIYEMEDRYLPRYPNFLIPDPEGNIQLIFGAKAVISGTNSGTFVHPVGVLMDSISNPLYLDSDFPVIDSIREYRKSNQSTIFVEQGEYLIIS